MRQYAVLHALQFLGEAARLVPVEERASLPSIPWAKIVGMRNIVAHNYLGWDPAVIFDTVARDLPLLLEELDRLRPLR